MLEEQPNLSFSSVQTQEPPETDEMAIAVVEHSLSVKCPRKDHIYDMGVLSWWSSWEAGDTCRRQSFSGASTPQKLVFRFIEKLFPVCSLLFFPWDVKIWICSSNSSHGAPVTIPSPLAVYFPQNSGLFFIQSSFIAERL